MRRIVMAVSFAAATLIALLAPAAEAQTRTARGTVRDMGADTMTIKAGDQQLAFMVDNKTIVTASGAGTSSRAAAAAGRSGPKLSDLIKVGDAVEVTYHDSSGTLHASKIRRTRNAASGGDSAAASTPTEVANGTVAAVSGSALTILGGSGGGSSFRQVFVIDRDTKVVAPGAGTRAREGAATAPDLVKVGDRVSVSYHKAGDALHAGEIRVR